jgi:hypothetical protein
MQCKDIPTEPIISFLNSLGKEPATWLLKEDGSPFTNSVQNAMPLNTPRKVALAKMKQMLRAKLITGCGCGCRGNFKIRKYYE